ncbi:hypothetical protein D3C83_270980 [compost metagenome]
MAGVAVERAAFTEMVEHPRIGRLQVSRLPQARLWRLRDQPGTPEDTDADHAQRRQDLTSH